MRPITVLLADNYAIEREAFRKLIGFEGDLEVVGEAQDGRQAITLAQKLRPDMVLMDFTMPQLNGLEAARQIKKVLPEIKVVIMVTHSDATLVRNAIACGVAGVLHKQISAEEVCRAIREAHRGTTVFNSPIYRSFDFGNGQSDGRPQSIVPVVQLSSREMEVLQLIAEGNANKQIAGELGISIKTIEKHRQLLMERLEIYNTAGLTRYAISAGIVESSFHVREIENGFNPVALAPIRGTNRSAYSGKINEPLPMEANLCH